jgi:hypothetical protein
VEQDTHLPRAGQSIRHQTAHVGTSVHTVFKVFRLAFVQGGFFYYLYHLNVSVIYDMILSGLHGFTDRLNEIECLELDYKENNKRN